MRIHVLGCSGGIGTGLRTTALLVNDRILIDAGTGVGDLSLTAIRQVDHVFLTHAHLDHIAGLPLFIDTAQGRGGRGPVTVHALAETLDALRRHVFNDVIWPDFSRIEGAGGPLLRYATVAPGDVVPVNGHRVGAVAVEHAVPSLGYWLHYEDRVFAFSGDTRSNVTLWPALNAQPRLDALLVEVSFPDAQHALAHASGHYCPHTLATDLERLEHRPPLWITAMKPGEEERILDEVRRALPEHTVQPLRDGAVIDL